MDFNWPRGRHSTGRDKTPPRRQPPGRASNGLAAMQRGIGHDLHCEVMYAQITLSHSGPAQAAAEPRRGMMIIL